MRSNFTDTLLLKSVPGCPQVRLLLRLLHAHRVPVLALLPRVQDATQLQRQALPWRLPPRHVGGPHEDPQGCQVREQAFSMESRFGKCQTRAQLFSILVKFRLKLNLCIM